MPVSCTLCSHPRRAEIDAAIRAGTSFRSVSRTFGPTKDVISRHARACCGIKVASRDKITAARKRSDRVVQQQIDAIPALKPIESAEDVIADLQRLRIEAFDLFDSAKTRADWKQAQMLFGQLVQIVDRFGEMHRVLGSKGVTVNVDNSTRKLEIAVGKMSNEELDAAIASIAGGGAIRIPAAVVEAGDVG